MSLIIPDIFDEVEPLSEIFTRQEEEVLKSVKTKNLSKAKMLIAMYSIKNMPTEIFKKMDSYESYKIEIEKFVKQREINLKKLILGL